MLRALNRSVVLGIAIGLMVLASNVPRAFADDTDRIDLSGFIYLFDYLPTIKGAQDYFEIYAYGLNVDAKTADEQYGLHVQARARDSKLRSFFLTNYWFQEAYMWRQTKFGQLHVGKFYRKVGILWDDSFFGNVPYWNGLMLNPDYGAEFVGSRPMGEKMSVDYSAQYFANNDHVAGSLPGRDVESDDNARLLEAWSGRIVPTWKLAEKSSLAIGISGYRGLIDRVEGPTVEIAQFAGDVTLSVGPSVTYAEVLVQDGEDEPSGLSRLGYDSATYLLGGTRWQLHPRINARISLSQAEYDGANSTESEIIPGVVVSLAPGVSLMVEYDYWEIEPDEGDVNVIDRSFNLIGIYSF